jgi:segregation and condensation protein A
MNWRPSELSSARIQPPTAGSKMIHQVQLETFEGPIELLLYLVREQELAIEEIPIARITDQYLTHIQSLPHVSIERAAEFLLLAVVLIRMKMRSLLPRPPAEDLETGTLVSMDEIVAEFQRYREAASMLAQREEERRRLFPRAGAAPRDYAGAGDVMLLTETLRAIMSRAEPADDWVVERVQLRIENALQTLRGLLIERRTLNFISYLAGLPRLTEVIITFLAALELARLGEVRISQDRETGAILLFYRPLRANPDPGVAPAD